MLTTSTSRYNLKRRVASLPPLSSEIFAEKVLANKASQAATAARASYEKSCSACQKTYYSENAFINHLSSQKHKSNATRQQRGAASNGDDGASMMSSTFSLGDPIETASNSVADGEAEREFADVISGIQKTKINDGEDTDEPLSQRPSRPHHSSTEGGDHTPHPLSETTTESGSVANGIEAPLEGPVRNCLFCNYLSPTFDTNIHHMTRQHDLFIPEREYLTDLEGLIIYLRAKVMEGHECLYCGKAKHTTSGIMTHMRDRGHCKIAFDSEEEQIEIGQFYDFRATYSDPEGEDDESDWSDDEEEDKTRSKDGAKLGAKRTPKTSIEAEDDGDAAMEDEGWETDSTLSSVPTDEIGSLPIDDRSHRYASLHNSRHHSHHDGRPHKASDGWHSRAHRTPHAVYFDDFEMHLPSGRAVGHRNMNKYWRQNLRSYPSAAERAERLAITNGTAVDVEDVDEDSDVDMDAPTPRPSSRNMQLQRGHDAGRQLVSNSRANGGLGMVGVSAAKKKEVSRAEKRERGRARRGENRYQAGNERRNNFQKHFRDPLLQ